MVAAEAAGIGAGGDGAADSAQLAKADACTVMNSLMDKVVEESAIGITSEAFAMYKKYKEIAGHIKNEMDKKHSDHDNKATEGVFHCIVGKSFAASVSHDCHDYVHLKVGLVHVILFKSRDSPFDFSNV